MAESIKLSMCMVYCAMSQVPYFCVYTDGFMLMGDECIYG